MVGLLVGIVVGLAPAVQVSHLHPNEELKATVQEVWALRTSKHLTRSAGGGEIAISLALLVGAGLLLRTFAKLREVDAGIHPEGILTAQIGLPANRYNKIEQAEAFFDRLLGGLKGSPGVEASAVGSQLPLEGGSNSYIRSTDGRNRNSPISLLSKMRSPRSISKPSAFRSSKAVISSDKTFGTRRSPGGRPWP